MNPEIKQIWIDALRSDRYNKGITRLCCTVNGTPYHCALGVLCEELCKPIDPKNQTLDPQSRPLLTKIPYSGETGCELPEIITYAFMFGDIGACSMVPSEAAYRIGLPEDVMRTCIKLNDKTNRPFCEIADYLQASL